MTEENTKGKSEFSLRSPKTLPSRDPNICLSTAPKLFFLIKKIFFNIYLFILAVLGLSCGMRDLLLWHAGLSP